MKRSKLTFLLAIVILSLFFTETIQHVVHKEAGKKSKETHTHESHTHHKTHEHRDLETHNQDHKNHDNIPDAEEDFIAASLTKISQNKVLMVVIAVVIVSLPSFPAFLILLSVSKFSSGGKKNKHLINEKYLRMMICLAIGSLTGDVFFGMMSHIIESHHHDDDHDQHTNGHEHRFQPEVFCIIVGIFFFYVVDRGFGGHEHDHGHDDEHQHSLSDVDEPKSENKTSQKNDNGQKKKDVKTNSPKEKSGQEIRNRNKGNKETTEKNKEENEDLSKYNDDPQDKISKSSNRSAVLYLVADFLHNVIDGIGIGVAFTINNSLGITTTVAVATHELPHEIGDFAILLKKNYSLSFILLTQLSTATGALFGGLLGIYFGNFAEKYLLGFTAGGFLYLALGNMVPELLKSDTKPTIWNLILEAGLGFFGAALIVISA